jgi:hypothetical protein
MVDMDTTTSSITIRQARSADAWALDRLAALDSARPLAGDVLLAEADGRPVAAVAVTDGAAIADPFTPSADAVAVLRPAACTRCPAADPPQVRGAAGCQRVGWRA